MSPICADAVASMTFPALGGNESWLRHVFVVRQVGVDVRADRDQALARLAGCHRRALTSLGFQPSDLATAEQVHGPGVARVDGGGIAIAGVDGLVSAVPGCVLGIHVADCCAVFLVDPVRRAIGLVHSGRKGSELGIVTRAIGAMEREFESAPGDLIVQFSPCIRPPLYEVDFAAMIRRDAFKAGVRASQIHDGGLCTGSDLTRFYSYRVEQGRTGRMLALLGLAGEKRSPETVRPPSSLRG